MAVQLNPSKIPVWNSETELQLGLSVGSQRIDNVTHAQERLINLLFQGVSEDNLKLVGSSVGLSELETSELVERLRPRLLEKTETHQGVGNLEVRFAEIIRIGFDTNLLPESVLGLRAKTLVQVKELNRTGLLMVRALAELGFKNFETLDFGVVSRPDCGELGYGDSSLGFSRLTAARALLHGKMSDVAISHPSKGREHPLVILSAMHRIAPSEFRELTSPHLAIEFGIENLAVSPVIVPGKTPCLRCRALWQTEVEPNWATTSIQLASRSDQLDDAVGLLSAVSIACRTVCDFLEANDPKSGIELDLKTRTTRALNWQFHPSCDCRKVTG